MRCPSSVGAATSSGGCGAGRQPTAAPARSRRLEKGKPAARSWSLSAAQASPPYHACGICHRDDSGGTRAGLVARGAGQEDRRSPTPARRAGALTGSDRPTGVASAQRYTCPLRRIGHRRSRLQTQRVRRLVQVTESHGSLASASLEKSGHSHTFWPSRSPPLLVA